MSTRCQIASVCVGWLVFFLPSQVWAQESGHPLNDPNHPQNKIPRCANGGDKASISFGLTVPTRASVNATAVAYLHVPNRSWVDVTLTYNGGVCSYSGRRTNPGGGGTEVTASCAYNRLNQGVHTFTATSRNSEADARWIRICYNLHDLDSYTSVNGSGN